MPIQFGIDIFHNTKLTIIKFMPQETDINIKWIYTECIRYT